MGTTAARLAPSILSVFYVGPRRLEQLRYLAGDPLMGRFCGLAHLPTTRTAVSGVEDWRGTLEEPVSSPRLVKRGERLSRTPLSCPLRVKGYATYRTESAFGRG